MIIQRILFTFSIIFFFAILSSVSHADVTIDGTRTATLVVDETTGNVAVDGAIQLNGPGISVEAETQSTIMVNGSVNIPSAFGNAIQLRENSSLSRIENFGVISGDSAIYLNGSSITSGILNEGTLQGGGDNGIEIVSSTLSGNIENRGNIFGGGSDSGIAIYGDWQLSGSINNSGLIRGGGEEAIFLSGTELDLSGASLISYGSFIEGDLVNSGVLEVVENGSSESTGVFAVLGGAELRGSLINTGQIINRETIPFKESSGIYVGKSVIANELVPNPLSFQHGAPRYLSLLDAQGLSIRDDQLSRISGNIINSGQIESVSGTAILIDSGVVDGVINAPSGVISASAATGFAINVINNGSLNLVSNEGVIKGHIDFGQNGGVYSSKGGQSGSIFNANRINIQVGLPSLSIADPSTGLTLKPTISTIAGGLDVSGKILGIDVRGTSEGVEHGQLVVTGNANLNNSEIQFSVSGDQFIAGGDRFTFVQGNNVSATNTTVVDDSLVLSFDVIALNNKLEAIANRTSFEALLLLDDVPDQLPKNTLSIAKGVDQAVRSLTEGRVAQGSELGSVISELSSLKTVEEVTAALDSLKPEAHQSGINGALQLGDNTASVINQRLANIRSYIFSGESGLPAGDEINDKGFWLQAYGLSADRDSEGGVEGYDLDSEGMALGYDFAASSKLTAGIALSSSRGDVDSKGIMENNLEIDSHQVTVYGNYSPANYFVEAQISYARNRYEGERRLFTGPTAHADRDGNQYGLRALVGYPINYDSGIRLTPLASLGYSYLDEEAYSEKGVGNAGLEVDEIDVETFVAGAGLEISSHYETQKNNLIVPSLYLEIQKNFLDDEVQLDSRFIGTSANFVTEGLKNSDFRYLLGFGIQFFSQGSVSLNLRYDYTGSSDYSSQALAGTVRYTF